jgi:two-component system, cell cycle response regulator
MKKRITLIILGSILSSYLILIIFSAFNIRDIGMRSAQDKAKTVAELVKDGLTAHMINGIMDNREYFLKKIENSKNIKALWVARSQSVIKQFGIGYNSEVPRDEIDKKVIQTGESFKEIQETTHNAYLRVTIPYTAYGYGNPNCMSCHDAKEGDVLGTVSMIIDVKDIRQSGINTSIIIFALAVLISFVVFYIIHRSLNPIINFFESIKYVMGKAQEGDYSKRVQTKEDNQEFQNVSYWINSFLDKLQATLSQIELTVSEFLTKNTKRKDKDILIELKFLVQEIANLHNFKRTIEFDKDKTQIYKRIGTLLEKRFHIDDFVLVESNKTDSKIVYSTFKNNKVINVECRAFRTKQVVNSEQFDKLCENCNTRFKHYICIPYTISNDLELLLHVGTESEEIFERVQENISKINDYINEAKPEIISKNLTEILQISSTTDALTGLYNRKYLDQYIDKFVAQAKRTQSPYGILMIDIDYFKMVNDTYGHDVGDKVIKVLADVFLSSIRESDIAFRFGGEEFLILLHNCTKEGVEEVAQKIRQNFEKQIIEVNTSKRFTKTLSIGTSLFPEDTNAIWKAIKYADMALYKAKNSGRNKVVSFSTELLEKANMSNNF